MSLYRMWVIVQTALVPVRLTPAAKGRLAHVLSSGERMELVGSLLDHVVDVLTRAGLTVVTLSPTPLDRSPAEVWIDEAPGLNAALDAALERLGTPILIVHADLPLLSVEDVHATLSDDADVVIARSVDGGTNGLLMRRPTCPAFGPASAVHHAEQARRLGMRASVLDLPGFALDVDDEAALAATAYTRP